MDPSAKLTFFTEMSVLGRCSACSATHYTPFESRCKKSKDTHEELQKQLDSGMAKCVAGLGFESQDDPNYLDFQNELYIYITGAAPKHKYKL